MRIHDTEMADRRPYMGNVYLLSDRISVEVGYGQPRFRRWPYF